MFLRILECRTPKGSYRYLKLVENAREKGKRVQRTLLNFGNVERWPRSRLEEFIRKLNDFYHLELVPTADDICPEDSFEFGAPYALDVVWQQLGLSDALRRHARRHKVDFDLVRPVKTMVFNRLLDPRSKLGVYRWARGQCIPEVFPERVGLHRYYRSLDYLMQYKQSLEEDIFWQVNDLFNLDLSLVFYDLTSSYFEGRGPSIARYGYSRDHRPDCRQIELALLIDRDGLPIAHEVFEGNRKDSDTVSDALSRLQGQFKIKRCVFVGDNGMVTPQNIALLEEEGYEYILSLKLHKDPLASAALKGLSPQEYPSWERLKENLFVKELDPPCPGRRIVALYNPIRARESRNGRQQKIQEAVEYLEGFALPRRKGQHKDPQKIHRQIERWLRKRHLFRFFTYRYHGEGHFEYRLREEVLATEAKCDGLCLLLTNSQQLSAEEVATGYRTLCEVEEAFRQIKSFLRIRPIWHYKELRVRGHVFICVLAYLLEKALERRLHSGGLSITAKRALETLAPVHLVTYEIMGTRVSKVTKLRPEHLKIFKSLGVDHPPKVYPLPPRTDVV